MRSASEVPALWLAAPGRWVTARRRSTPPLPRWWPLGRTGDCLLVCLVLWWLLGTAVHSSRDRGRESGIPAPPTRRDAEFLDGLDLAERVVVVVAWRESRGEPGAQRRGATAAPQDMKQPAVGAPASRGRSAKAGLGITVLLTAFALPVCILAGAPARLTVGVVIALLGLGIGLSLLTLVRRSETRWPLEPLIVGLLCEAGFGVLLIVEGARNKVLVGDEVATLMGVAAIGVTPILQAVVGRLQR
jgi:hypothetical protein